MWQWKRRYCQEKYHLFAYQVGYLQYPCYPLHCLRSLGHEGNDEVTLDAEGLEDGGLRLGHGHDAGRVLPYHSGKHHVKARKDDNREQEIPPGNTLQSAIVIHTDERNLDADGRPEEAIDKEKVPGGNLKQPVYFL